MAEYLEFKLINQSINQSTTCKYSYPLLDLLLVFLTNYTRLPSELVHVASNYL